MPELPEVSVVIKYLQKNIVNLKLTKIKILKEKIIKNVASDELEPILKNQKITALRRRGKYILIDFEQNTLVIHLRMEGKLIFYKKEEFTAQKHDCVYLYFGEDVLVYNDVRVFGTFEIVKLQEENELKSIAKLGLEYDSSKLDAKFLKEKLSNKNQAIKTQLLSQSIFTGLGNIYVDEILLLSKVHPLTKSKCVSLQDCTSIIENSIKVMNKSIECGGSSVRSYSSGKNTQGTYQNYLVAYGRTNLECLICKKDVITKIKVNGRGTHFCKNCQKEKIC